VALIIRAGVTVGAVAPEAAAFDSAALGLYPAFAGVTVGAVAPEKASFDSLASSSSPAKITVGRRSPVPSSLDTAVREFVDSAEDRRL
jgi:hypothetical protein